MRYIKLFENESKGYWIIKTDEPYFEISLRKIGIPEYIIKRWLENQNIQRYDKLCVTIDNTYSHIPVELLSVDQFRKCKIIEIDKSDLEDWKLRQDTNKYNL